MFLHLIITFAKYELNVYWVNNYARYFGIGGKVKKWVQFSICLSGVHSPVGERALWTHHWHIMWSASPKIWDKCDGNSVEGGAKYLQALEKVAQRKLWGLWATLQKMSRSSSDEDAAKAHLQAKSTACLRTTKSALAGSPCVRQRPWMPRPPARPACDGFRVFNQGRGVEQIGSVGLSTWTL